MGQFANGRIGNLAAILGTAAVLSLNVILVLETVGIAVPGLPSPG
jgi:manganese transport protein